MSLCTRCGAEFTAPAGLEMSLNIRASYCETCATETNAKFSSLFGTKAAKIVDSYHHQSHRFADGLVSRATALGVYESEMHKAHEGLAPADVTEFFETFEELLVSHLPNCPICSQNGI